MEMFNTDQPFRNLVEKGLIIVLVAVTFRQWSSGNVLENTLQSKNEQLNDIKTVNHELLSDVRALRQENAGLLDKKQQLEDSYNTTKKDFENRLIHLEETLDEANSKAEGCLHDVKSLMKENAELSDKKQACEQTCVKEKTNLQLEINFCKLEAKNREIEMKEDLQNKQHEHFKDIQEKNMIIQAKDDEIRRKNYEITKLEDLVDRIREELDKEKDAWKLSDIWNGLMTGIKNVLSDRRLLLN